MKIVILGFSYFTKYIASNLSKQYPEDSFLAFDTYAKNTDKIKAYYHMLSADVLYYINGATSGSRFVNFALKKKKKIVFHWVGTDVRKAEQAIATNSYDKRYIQIPTHITDTPWFVDRLQAIGINASFKALKPIYPPKIINAFPPHFRVLSYMQKGKEEFYGINHLIDLAKALKDISIDILGIDKYHQELPSNIHLLGWQKDINKHLNNSCLCVRMPKTDGLSFFVLEALSHQRYVIYSKKWEQSLFASNSSELIALCEELYKKHKNKALELNQSGAKFVNHQFHHEKVLTALMEVFKDDN